MTQSCIGISRRIGWRFWYVMCLWTRSARYHARGDVLVTGGAGTHWSQLCETSTSQQKTLYVYTTDMYSLTTTQQTLPLTVDNRVLSAERERTSP